jgi:hypothetical protein
MMTRHSLGWQLLVQVAVAAVTGVVQCKGVCVVTRLLQVLGHVGYTRRALSGLLPVWLLLLLPFLPLLLLLPLPVLRLLQLQPAAHYSSSGQ